MAVDKELVKVNVEGLNRKLRAAGQAGVRSADVATQIIATEFVTFVFDNSKRDTNRFVAAWAEAGNAAGLGPYQVPPIVASRFHDYAVPRLEAKADFWDRVAHEKREHANRMQRQYTARYAKPNRRDKQEVEARRRLNEAVRAAEKAEKIAARALEEFRALQADPTAIVIWGRKLKAGVADEDDTRVSRLHRAITKAEGGEAFVLRIDGKVYYRLRNKEAHASIVESRTHVVKTGLAIARAVGLQRASREVKAMIRAQIAI